MAAPVPGRDTRDFVSMRDSSEQAAFICWVGIDHDYLLLLTNVNIITKIKGSLGSTVAKMIYDIKIW